MLVRADVLVRAITWAQNTLFLAHTVGTISQRGLRDGGRLFAEALGSASGRGVGVDGIGRGLPLASAARAYLSHCFAALTHFCTDREAECW